MKLLNLYFFIVVSWSGQDLIMSCISIKAEMSQSHFEVTLGNLCIENHLAAN